MFSFFFLAALTIGRIDVPELKHRNLKTLDRLNELYKSHPLFNPKVEKVPDSTFGFYLHVFKNPHAVVYMVDRLYRIFPDSPVYIMSDGGLDYTPLCERYGCTFKLCPPANDRWHPWPFMHRLWEAAVHLKTDYVIMLEPDNTIHRSIYIKPDRDAGGLSDANGRFGHPLVNYLQNMGRKVRPGFTWNYTGSGLAGGSYFKTSVILDAFNDHAVNDFNFTEFQSLDSFRIFSSDFAMPLLLSAKGYNYEPWREIRQEDMQNGVQPLDSAFAHYGSGRPGRKPTYSIDLDLGDPGQYYKESTYLKNRVFQLCQQCYSLKQYKARFGSDECTNHLAEGDRQSPLSILDLKLFLFKKFEDEEGGRSGYHKNVLLPTKLRLQAAEESRLARNRMIDQLITPNETAL
eukprot:m.10082 g.10082  ORF g.10082 m.10082 type:complete len:402 (+) comp4198_c0_seq1:206-1411(+)